MIKKVSSTYLKQNTREVLESILREPELEYLVYSYNKPRVIITSIHKKPRVSLKKSSSLENIKRLMIKEPKLRNSAKLIRKSRDEEF